jgi:hypothetical protein
VEIDGPLENFQDLDRELTQTRERLKSLGKLQRQVQRIAGQGQLGVNGNVQQSFLGKYGATLVQGPKPFTSGKQRSV